jgi:hypothetical protein
MLSEIQTSAERLYQNGTPLHHLDSARSLDYDPQASHFFVTTPEQLEKLTTQEIQEIFRHRHILIPGPPPRDFHFDSQGLATLGSLTAPRQIQGIS